MVNNMKNKISIKAISFDFWGTLYNDMDSDTSTNKRKEARISTIEELIQKNNVSISRTLIQNTLSDEWDHFKYIWKTQHITPKPVDRVKYIINNLELSVSSDDLNMLAEKFKNITFESSPLLAPNLLPVLEVLSNHNIPMCIVSDTGWGTGEILKKVMEKDKILKYFQMLSFSDETGVSKPQGKAFQIILDSLESLKPTDILHIGDIERTDIVGALNFGMYAGRYIGLSESSKDNIYTSAHILLENWNDLFNFIELNGNGNYYK